MEPIMKRQQKNHLQMLPEDLLADVLRRLSPRSLAVSRCVCKAWHAIVDAHKLLRADLLPLSFRGLMMHFNMLGRPEFFSYRGPGPGGCAATTTPAAVSGDLLGYLPHPNIGVDDHCNGLLLLFQAVANPATLQWSRFPWQPPPRMGGDVTTYDDAIIYEQQYLVFDPAISPYYEVFLMPVVPLWAELDRATAESEWPPLSYETHVFSSRTGRWEQRSFVREGDPAGTMADVQQAYTSMKRYSVYWREALYIHCQNDFFCKVSVTDNKYQVIKPPATSNLLDDGPRKAYLGKSENGVYCAMLDGHEFRLRVWILRESSGHMEWELKHEKNLAHVLASRDFYQKADGDWTFEDVNHHVEWPRDNNNGAEEEHEDQSELKEHSYLNLLGFHPFKETVFLNSSLSRGFSYDLNSSKVQDLGNMCPMYYRVIAGQHAYIQSSFPYTPCWMDIPKREILNRNLDGKDDFLEEEMCDRWWECDRSEEEEEQCDRWWEEEEEQCDRWWEEEAQCDRLEEEEEQCDRREEDEEGAAPSIG